jgi:hypothetical protein
MNNSVVAFLDGIRRTHLSTGGLIAVPAYVRGRGDALAALDEIEVNHRLSAMSFAFLASLQTRAASDAARGIDVELVPEN